MEHISPLERNNPSATNEISRYLTGRFITKANLSLRIKSITVPLFVCDQFQNYPSICTKLYQVELFPAHCRSTPLQILPLTYLILIALLLFSEGGDYENPQCVIFSSHLFLAVTWVCSSVLFCTSSIFFI